VFVPAARGYAEGTSLLAGKQQPQQPPPPTGRCSTRAILCGTLLGMTTVGELMRNAVDARRVAQNAIALAVREARADGWSWDRISAALGGTPNGETLRRNFGGETGVAS
jgi:hypothetical protein